MPLIVVMLFNLFMLAVALRVIVNQNRKKFFQGGDRYLMKMAIRNLVSLVWLMVLFGVGWLFGLLTIRGASPAFQYIFVILNAFQGFYFFFFIVLNQKEARIFWANILTRGLFRPTKFIRFQQKVLSSSDNKMRGNLGHLTALPANTNQRKNHQLVNYLTLPDPVLLSNSFASTNETILEPQSVSIHAVREESTVDDFDSRIEVTTYFDGSEEDMGILVNHNTRREILLPELQPEVHGFQPEADINLPTQVNSPENAHQAEEVDETPIPPVRRKRKNNPKAVSATNNHNKPNDSLGGAEWYNSARKSEPVYKSGRQQSETECAAVDSEGDAAVQQKERRRQTTHHKKTADQMQAPFMISNPVYFKEE